MEFGSSVPLFAASLSDVEPLLLPLLDGLIKGACRPCDHGHLAHHGASALGVLAVTTLGFTLKIFSHKPKCGEMRRKASHTTMNVEMLRKDLGDRS